MRHTLARWAEQSTAPPSPSRRRTAPGGRPRRTRRLPPRHLRQDRGSATVELAVSLPGLILVLLTGLAAVNAVRHQIECVDAAREAALAAARGEPGVPAGQRVAPAGAVVHVSVADDVVRATVRVRVSPFGRRLPGIELSATAVAATEPGVSGRVSGHD